MPRPRPQTSALRSPLDFILGTLGSVRTLRVLSTVTVPLSQAEIARRADVTLSALPALLANLETAGVIAYEGRGRTRQIVVNNRHPIVRSLGLLFRDERDRWERIQNELRQIAQSSTPELVCAWLGGPAAVRQDRFTDPLVWGLLTETPLPIARQEDLRTRANIVQSREHLIIALRFYQYADLLRFTAAQLDALKSAIVLYGPAPFDLISARMQRVGNSEKNPALASRRSGKSQPSVRALAAWIAEHLVKEPEFIADARNYIERRLPHAGQVERLALIEWQGLLDTLTPAQLAALLREDSERADELRQNIPFLGKLTDDERAAVRSALIRGRKRRS
ncbi:MAG: hypothetical protein ACRENH_15415 [Gemmatimonadaceae bacterium]